MSQFNSEEATAQLKATLSRILPELEWFSESVDVATQLSNAFALGSQWFPEVQASSYDDFTSYVLSKVPSMTASTDEWELAALQYFWAESLRLALKSLTMADLEQILRAFGDDCDTLWQQSLRNNRHLLHTQKQAKVLATRYRLLMVSKAGTDHQK